MGNIPFWKRANASEVKMRALELVGRCPRDFAPSAKTRRTARGPKSKGKYGAYIEEHFDIRMNSRKEVDFPKAGVELKTVGVSRTKGGPWTARERTKVCSLNPQSVWNEEWNQSEVRTKLRHVLFVFYERRFDDSCIEDLPVTHVALWKLAANKEYRLLWESEYDIIRKEIRAYRGDRLSSRLTRSLHAHTTGTGNLRRQANGKTPLMKERGFGIKRTFATDLANQSEGRVVRLLPSPPVKSETSLEYRLMRRLEPWVLRRVGELRASIGAPDSKRKDQVASLLRKYLGIPNTNRVVVSELLQAGLQVKTVRLARSGAITEAVSFPSFSHFDYAEESSFADSEFSEYIQRVLFLPHRAGARGGNDNRILEAPVLWIPTSSELKGIEREWRMYQRFIRSGLADMLPPESATEFIHVRPKNTSDGPRDSAPGLADVQRKSIWLNREFVGRLLQRS